MLAGVAMMLGAMATAHTSVASEHQADPHDINTTTIGTQRARRLQQKARISACGSRASCAELVNRSARFTDYFASAAVCGGSVFPSHLDRTGCTKANFSVRSAQPCIVSAQSISNNVRNFVCKMY